MKRSRLYDEHVKRGASFIEQAGWEVPAHYGDPVAEHLAVRSGVGVTDLSQRGKLRITGEDRVKWLQSVISNDILPLAAGEGIYSCFLTHKGKMLTYFRVYQSGEALMLEDVGEIGDVTFSALRKFLLYGTKAKMENCAESWGLLLISGPKASDVIKGAWSVDLSALKPLTFVTHDTGGYHGMMIRTEETGETDIELLIPADGLKEAWERLWAAGQSIGLKLFGAAVDAYAGMLRDHMRKEDELLEQAGQDLAEEDWSAIAAAFDANDDPLFGKNQRAEFNKLYLRIINLLPRKMSMPLRGDRQE